jgi:hypothetical protein
MPYTGQRDRTDQKGHPVEIPRRQFDQAAEDAGLDPMEDVVYDYSGRVMYGASCPALWVAGHAEAHRFVVALTVIATQQSDGPGLSPDDLMDWAASTRTDQMGQGIVVYWPGLELTA